MYVGMVVYYIQGNLNKSLLYECGFYIYIWIIRNTTDDVYALCGLRGFLWSTSCVCCLATNTDPAEPNDIRCTTS